MLRAIGLPELLVIMTFGGLLLVLPFWKIFAKAGFPGILSVAMLVPLINVMVLFVVAFTEWPVVLELNALKAKNAAG